MSLCPCEAAPPSPNRFCVDTAPAYRATSTWLLISAPPLSTMRTQPLMAHSVAHSGTWRRAAALLLLLFAIDTPHSVSSVPPRVREPSRPTFKIAESRPDLRFRFYGRYRA
ncbi:hypothetical protein GCM10012284_09000 [Mangrovihabitans endophyticus]|uniref:Uncharacterized protein n=1 Tax=Mangrovihabitans endophyticus TaxID=1751298 RepID=A0A8J3BX98_9ACTN|nr:hypothetical protein GCM10012284_09000 [Mangrovihabitans endophyticus]